MSNETIFSLVVIGTAALFTWIGYVAGKAEGRQRLSAMYDAYERVVMEQVSRAQEEWRAGRTTRRQPITHSFPPLYRMPESHERAREFRTWSVFKDVSAQDDHPPGAARMLAEPPRYTDLVQ